MWLRIRPRPNRGVVSRDMGIWPEMGPRGRLAAEEPQGERAAGRGGRLALQHATAGRGSGGEKERGGPWKAPAYWPLAGGTRQPCCRPGVGREAHHRPAQAPGATQAISPKPVANAGRLAPAHSLRAPGRTDLGCSGQDSPCVGSSPARVAAGLSWALARMPSEVRAGVHSAARVAPSVEAGGVAGAAAGSSVRR